MALVVRLHPARYTAASAYCYKEHATRLKWRDSRSCVRKGGSLGRAAHSVTIATIEIVLADQFTFTGAGPNFGVILQRWPQSPPAPPPAFIWTSEVFGNTIKITLTDDFKVGQFGPAAKQLHLILLGFTNPALPGVFPVDLTIKPKPGSSKTLSGSGHVRIVPDARPSVNPIGLFSGPPGPPPPFFNPIY